MSISRNSIYNVIGSLTPLILAVTTIPLYLVAIGIERYGALAIAWLILGYFGLFDLGLGRAATQKIAAAKESTDAKRNEIYWTALIISFLVGLIGALCIWGVGYVFINKYFQASDTILEEVFEALPFLGLILPIVTASSVVTGTLQGREYFIEYNLGIILGSALFQLLPLVTAWYWGTELYLLIISAGFARLLAFIFTKYLLWRKMLYLLKPSISKGTALDLLRFGGWMTLTGIIAPVIYMVDRFVISAVLGAAAVALYVIPYQISSRLSIIPTALNNAVFPRMSSANREQERRIWILSTKVTLAIMTPIIVGLVFNMHWLLKIWIGAEIAQETYLIGQILLISSWGLGIALIPLTVLHSRAQPKKPLIAYAIEAPLYIIALWYGLDNYGLIGAAIAYAFRCTINAILLSTIAGFYPVKYLCLISYMFSILSIFAAQYYQSNFNLWIIFMLFGLVIAMRFSYIIMPRQLKDKALNFMKL